MPAETGRPNLLLITSDQQRYDTLGVNGSRCPRTPHLDRLADEGVSLDRAYVQNPICIPSRACFQTGRYTHQHGVRYMEEVIDRSPGLPPWEITFMERLQAAGYETGAAGKIHMMPERGFDWMAVTGGKGERWTQETGQAIGPAPLGRAYAEWLEARSPGAYGRIYEQRRQPEYREQMAAIVNVLPLDDYVESFILEQAIEFITTPRPGPFFLWCGFCGPHGPHDPPASHAGLYPFEEVPLPATLFADISDKPPHLRRPRWRDVVARQGETPLRRWISYYYALVTLIDEMVGRLVETLVQTGLLENTLVIYTSDHGEMLGQFGLSGKANFYEPVIQVPLIVSGLRGRLQPRRFQGLAEVMDVAATILDYAGVEKPAVMQAESLRPVVEGGGEGAESVLCEYTSENRQFSGKCLRTERYKYVLWNCEEGGEFYDLYEDPEECRNLWGDRARRDERDRHARLLLTRLTNSERPYTGRMEHPY